MSPSDVGSVGDNRWDELFVTCCHNVDENASFIDGLRHSTPLADEFVDAVEEVFPKFPLLPKA